MRALVRLQLRQMLGGKRKFLGILILLLPILLTFAIRAAGGPGVRGASVDAQRIQEAFYLVFLFSMFALFANVLLSLLYATSLVSQELEAKTLTYLFSRPLPKWKILTGQYLATASVVAVGSCAAAALAWIVSGFPEGTRGLLAVLVPCAVGAFAYGALFCLIGLLAPRKSIPVGFVYAIAVEGFCSWIPAAINQATINHHLRALAYRLSGLTLPRELREVEELIINESVPRALFAVVLLAALCLAVSSWIISQRQFVVNEQA
jgi:ABC-type transport system involved in multi-copper enzyme maturation permease subunit